MQQCWAPCHILSSIMLCTFSPCLAPPQGADIPCIFPDSLMLMAWAQGSSMPVAGPDKSESGDANVPQKPTTPCCCRPRAPDHHGPGQWQSPAPRPVAFAKSVCTVSALWGRPTRVLMQVLWLFRWHMLSQNCGQLIGF